MPAVYLMHPLDANSMSASDEMVHCFQHNCHGTAPGGLIEGIADFVRLKAGLAPPHWNRSPANRGRRWDEGYQKTAWFLEWLEEKRGAGTVSHMNEAMRTGKYDEKKFWHDIFGESVDKLWGQYQETWEAEDQNHACDTIREQSSGESDAEVVNLNDEEKQEAMKEGRRPKEFVA